MRLINVDGKKMEMDEDCYKAGKEAVTKGVNIETCNFKNFGTRLKMESWQLGYDENGGKKEAS